MGDGAAAARSEETAEAMARCAGASLRVWIVFAPAGFSDDRVCWVAAGGNPAVAERPVTTTCMDAADMTGRTGRGQPGPNTTSRCTSREKASACNNGRGGRSKIMGRG